MSERTAEQILDKWMCNPHNGPVAARDNLLAALADAGLHLCREGEVPPWMEQCEPWVGFHDAANGVDDLTCTVEGAFHLSADWRRYNGPFAVYKLAAGGAVTPGCPPADAVATPPAVPPTKENKP